MQRSRYNDVIKFILYVTEYIIFGANERINRLIVSRYCLFNRFRRRVFDWDTLKRRSSQRSYLNPDMQRRKQFTHVARSTKYYIRFTENCRRDENPIEPVVPGYAQSILEDNPGK